MIGLLPYLTYAQSCDTVKITDFPAKDRPTASEKASLQKLESYKYYYGIGVPVDYVKARKIAFIEVEKDPVHQLPLEGYSILMMIYANGYGVKQDLDFCIRLACADTGDADAGIQSRKAHLERIKYSNSKERFDYCDDVFGYYGTGFCTGVKSEIVEQKIKSTIEAIIKKWPDSERVAFKSLWKVAKAFFESRAGYEVDQSGTYRVSMVNQEVDSLNTNFLEMTQHARKCDFIKYNQQEFEVADKKLNATFQQLMKGKEFEEHKDITKEGIKFTQQSWITYRNAWVSFLKIHCPTIPANSIKTLLTKERISQLKELVEFQEDL